jgi:hypothetical protein
MSNIARKQCHDLLQASLFLINIITLNILTKYFTYLVKVTMKEDYLSNFWANLEESQRAHKGSLGGSADGSKFRHYDSTSRLFENDTSLLSSGTNEKVGEPAQADHGESLHY